MRHCALFLLACGLAAQQTVLVPEGADASALARLAASVRPSPRQLSWQQHGFVAFVHFGMNTFTDREWGDGAEEPGLFAPTDFSADQWAEVFAAAGMKGVVLTCKHHDGFCLWPSASTEHDVARSPFRGGQGDVVAEVAAACRAHGLSFGVYLSPWDRNCKAFGTKAYHEVFQTQLRELCTGYGPLFEVWFDGAHCPADDPEVFDWQAHFRLVRKLQPQACIAITGPDVRWVGNEAGKTREQEWSVLPLDHHEAGAFEDSRAAWASLWRLRAKNQEADLGSIASLRGARRLCWWPAETDVSIRPGWFYHEAEDQQVKSVDQLFSFYCTATGGNAVLLLNVPPDRNGRIAGPDAAALRGLGDRLARTFGQDLAAEAMRRESKSTVELFFAGERAFNVLDLREDVANCGQCVERFVVETWDGAAWSLAQAGTTIGVRRILRLPATTARGVRCRIEAQRGPSRLLQLSVHLDR